MTPPALLIEQPGVSALVQDLGRHGHAHYGVSPSGAADLDAHLRANALVGNRPSAATLELIPAGFVCQFIEATTFALCGAPAVLELNGVQLPGDSVHAAPAGARLRLAAPAWGLRSYLAVRGGIDVTPVLGSRATDTLSGLGSPPLHAGMQVPIGDAIDSQDWRAPAPTGPAHLPVPLTFTPTAAPQWVDLAPLASQLYRVRPDSTRTALRLTGPALNRVRVGEFPPQGIVRGVVQVPPDGLPIIFLADHPVTGGYPVIGVVHDSWHNQLAQLAAGDGLYLRPDDAALS